MTPYFHDEHLTVYHGDTREVMAQMEPESVHCVVTSPPYWGLRDYGTATWEGGDPECDHKPDVRPRSERPNPSGAGIGKGDYPGQLPKYGAECGKCGSRRIDAQLGLEPTPEEYVANMVAVFREVRRVLRADGTVWLNLGDSYAGGTGTGRNDEGPITNRAGGSIRGGTKTKLEKRDGLKPKDLVGIPWRVAFALQADGWYLRSDIIWAKPNPMPESVTDRPTKSHEYLFLLAKSQRYYFDADAVREEQSPDSIQSYERAKVSPRDAGVYKQNAAVAHIGAGETVSPNAAWSDPEKLDRLLSRGRNIRSVWTVATQPYPGAHFATFPQKLVEPCVKAGCPEGGVVLDPFAGSGTTGIVAANLGRRAVLIDLSMDYLGQLMERNAQKPLGLIG